MCGGRTTTVLPILQETATGWCNNTSPITTDILTKVQMIRTSMDSPDVTKNILTVASTQGAVRTRERLLSCVTPHMSLQLRFFSNLVITDPTLVHCAISLSVGVETLYRS